MIRLQDKATGCLYGVIFLIVLDRADPEGLVSRLWLSIWYTWIWVFLRGEKLTTVFKVEKNHQVVFKTSTFHEVVLHRSNFCTLSKTRSIMVLRLCPSVCLLALLCPAHNSILWGLESSKHLWLKISFKVRSLWLLRWYGPMCHNPFFGSCRLES